MNRTVAQAYSAEKPEPYGWIITWANHEFLDIEEVGTMGPSDVTFTAEELKAKGRYFKMYDDDGEHYYSGYLLGGDGFEPKDDFGEPNAGCTEIRYKGVTL